LVHPPLGTEGFSGAANPLTPPGKKPIHSLALRASNLSYSSADRPLERQNF